MTFLRLFLRDFAYFRKPYIAAMLATCLISGVLTGALLIGDSVRGTQLEQWNRNAGLVQKRVRFSSPVRTDARGGVLHVVGYADPGVKTQVFAFPDTGSECEEAPIRGRDAFCSSALAEKLKLRDGDTFTVRMQTAPTIPSEHALGLPPRLMQVRLVFRGVWADPRGEIQLESSQLRAHSLFVSHDFLTHALELPTGAVNEIWTPDADSALSLDDDTIWELSKLYFDTWNGRPVLKSRAFFLPSGICDLFPEAARGATTFVESMTDGVTTLNYFFAAAYENDIFPCEPEGAVLSCDADAHFTSPCRLTFFTSDSFRAITRESCVLPTVTRRPDTTITSALTPEIPGLTDVSDCSGWDAGVPIDFRRVTDADRQYWARHGSKPKLYLPFDGASERLFSGKCNVLIFAQGADVAKIRAKIIQILRREQDFVRTTNVAEVLRGNIECGIHFAGLFLGLSLFIVLSAWLALALTLKLHFHDRAENLRTISDFSTCGWKVCAFQTCESLVVLIPGMLAGLGVGACLCRLQLLFLEGVWNDIVRINRLDFHAEPGSFFLALGGTFIVSLVAVIWGQYSVASARTVFCHCGSVGFRSFPGLGTLSFLRFRRQNRACAVLLILGFLGTLGVGAFGIKNRGEDAFSYAYVAETALPVVPEHDAPFPHGVFPVRVMFADSADCSNLLRAATPTVYGCDVAALTGDAVFLAPFHAAADAGSMRWIMKKSPGDTIPYSRGAITLERVLRASVFQRGILVDNATFEALFPEIQGAQMFLIRDAKTAREFRSSLEPFGVELASTDAFMARAESFQNRYLAIFMQLGSLGFILGVGSLVLMMLRNLRERGDEILLLRDLGYSRWQLFALYWAENVWLYLTTALFSLAALATLALFVQIRIDVLLVGWALLTAMGVFLITATLASLGFRSVRPSA